MPYSKNSATNVAEPRKVTAEDWLLVATDVMMDDDDVTENKNVNRKNRKCIFS